MTPAPDDLQPASRSRWRRFSPSMGWRAFWSEIVIVVLGVVIALAANEAVQDWSWRDKVQDSETRLHGDITWAFLWSAEKYVSQPCADAQLAALGRDVLESGDSLTPAPVLMSNGLPYVVRMPNRPYRFPAWDALVADGTATHFALQRQAFLGRVSAGMADARQSEVETRRLMGSLMVMRDPIPLDPTVRAELLTHIEELRSLTMFEAVSAQQRLRLIADSGSAPPADVVESFLNISASNASSSEFSGTVQFCKARGLPLADWRDYRKVTVSDFFHPATRVGK
jgi:hypothetical protein